MKKKLFVLMIVIMALLTSPALAGSHSEAGGDWSYIVTDVDEKVAGLNTFMKTYDEGIWTGTFDGESTEIGMVVVHPSGKTSFNGTLTFDGEVDGKTGKFTMSVVGQCCDEQGWKGQWVILSGTDELAKLRGQGTWYGWGAGGPFVWGTVEYEGTYHFEP